MTSFVFLWNFFAMDVAAESIPADEHVDQVLPHGSGPSPTLFAALKVLPATI